MKKNAFQLWKTAACLTAAVLIPLGLSALSPAAPERPVEETAPLEEQEIPVTEKSTYPYIEIHGDYRWLWGRGQFRADSLPAPNKVRRHDERVYLATRAACASSPSSTLTKGRRCARSSKTCATIKSLTPTITYISAASTYSTNKTGSKSKRAGSTTISWTATSSTKKSTACACAWASGMTIWAA